MPLDKNDDLPRRNPGQKPEKAKTHIRMVRNQEQYPAPHSANVHVSEVANWSQHGWVSAD